MYFGAESQNWDEDVFFYRVGIAKRLWEKGVGKSIFTT